MSKGRTYIAIDLKSFYASVECIEWAVDPMKTNLVVADESRTDKTICLAVSPALKSFGIPGRPRLFEVIQKVKEINAERLRNAPGRKFVGFSYDVEELRANPALELDYIVAPPRMAYYLKYSTLIYEVYCKYVSPQDIHVYSIDEVFIDATPYLKHRGMTAREFAIMIIRDVLITTGITATVGIGTNLYLAKVAMDIVAKHTEADKDGVRIAELDELSYRRQLWSHKPLTDFWRVGHGYAHKLEANGIYTMGDIARCSIGEDGDFYNEELLYKLFGVNAELLIDHAWGWEPCTIADIKAYRPSTNSLSSGQVLHQPYTFEKAKLVTQEMADALVNDLVEKALVTNQLTLTVGYDVTNLTNETIAKNYAGAISTDAYGRKKPKHAHGTANLDIQTSSASLIINAVMELYDRIVDKNLLVRRITLNANKLVSADSAATAQKYEQLDLFGDHEEDEKRQAALEKEHRRQKAIVDIKRKYGKNAILKGMNYDEGATAKDRNRQIGGHRA